jgi:hypothetical protein
VTKTALRAFEGLTAAEYKSRLGVFAVSSLLCSALLVLLLGAASASAACPNVVFRTGPSGKLPDCRAYELVTPDYTGGVPPTGLKEFSLSPDDFPSTAVGVDGNSVVYQTIAGGLPGLPGTGNVDRYRAVRTEDGWVTKNLAATGDEAEQLAYGGAITFPGGAYSAEVGLHIYPSLWEPFANVTNPVFLRTPTGVEPMARGSLGDDPYGRPWGMTPNHIFFSDSKKLELNAPTLASGEIIYDRVPGGPTHVVSLLPGNVTPTTSMAFLSNTPDGREVAFREGVVEGGNTDNSRLFVRRNNGEANEETVEILRPDGTVAGKQLTCGGGPTSGATLEYQWLRNTAPIPGATSASYTIAAADEGKVLQCMVTASNSGGTTFQTTATMVVQPYLEKTLPETGPQLSASISPETFNGTVPVGQVLTCNPGSFKGSPTITYQWLRNGTPLGGATNSTYTTLSGDVNDYLQCRATAATADGAAVVYSNRAVTVNAPFARATANPAITDVTDSVNPPAVGDELSCSTGTWSNSPSFAYQWLRGGAEIAAATSSTYTVVAEDEGKTLQCRVSATTSYGTTAAVSSRVVVDPQPGTAPPALTTVGSVFSFTAIYRPGQTLNCENGSWSGSGITFGRQWLRNGAPIGGATSTTYTLTASDVGTVVQCAVTAANAGGSTVAINANEGANFILPAAAPTATAVIVKAAVAALQGPGYTFDGLFNGHAFYADVRSNQINEAPNPADLYTIDVATQKTEAITDTGDASFVNVSEDGSHVYFTSPSKYNGEGVTGQPNLYVWSRADSSIKLVVTLSPTDVVPSEAPIRNGLPALNDWPRQFIDPGDEDDFNRERDHSRTTPNGETLAFESTASLTPFNNVEAEPDDCRINGNLVQQPGKQACSEVYIYDASTGDMECVSCPPGNGPAHSEGRLQSMQHVFIGLEVSTGMTPIESLTRNGEELFFETGESLVPRDRNETYDVYRWKRGEGVALISSGRNRFGSFMYGVTPDGSNVVFATRDTLLPQDENGSTVRFYDARVDGGFPPPESTVTEPCSNDVCQGQPSAAPEEPQISSGSIEGFGDFKGKLKCGKGLRRVEQHGKETCAPRRKRRHHQRHRRARSHHDAGAVR